MPLDCPYRGHVWCAFRYGGSCSALLRLMGLMALLLLRWRSPFLWALCCPMAEAVTFKAAGVLPGWGHLPLCCRSRGCLLALVGRCHWLCRLVVLLVKCTLPSSVTDLDARPVAGVITNGCQPCSAAWCGWS